MINTVAIIGSGFMGIQIAVRAILHGSSVRIYDLKKEALDKARNDIKLIIDVYSLEGEFKGDPEPFHKRVSYYSTLADVVKDTDLIIEIVPERLELKREVFTQLDKLAPASTIIATNSSSLPVSKIESAVARGDKVANLHFYAPVMKNYFVDIGGGTATSKETIDALQAWARIRLQPDLAFSEKRVSCILGQRQCRFQGYRPRMDDLVSHAVRSFRHDGQRRTRRSLRYRDAILPR